MSRRSLARRLARQVMAVLGDKRFAPLFAPGSRAEVSIAGKVMLNGELRTVAGYVDRLAVTDTEILIGDYKTNRPPPTANRRRAAQLCSPTCALPRGAAKNLSNQAGAGRADLDRNP